MGRNGSRWRNEVLAGWACDALQFEGREIFGETRPECRQQVGTAIMG